MLSCASSHGWPRNQYLSRKMVFIVEGSRPSYCTTCCLCVVAADTNVFILLLFVEERCTTNLYFREGINSSKEVITYHVTSLYNYLGANIYRVLPGFHALTDVITKSFLWMIKIWDLQENVSNLSVSKCYKASQ